jgi:hypothetical protein
MTAVTCTVTLRTHARLAAENSQQRVQQHPHVNDIGFRAPGLAVYWQTR